MLHPHLPSCWVLSPYCPSYGPVVVVLVVVDVLLVVDEVVVVELVVELVVVVEEVVVVLLVVELVDVVLEVVVVELVVELSGPIHSISQSFLGKAISLAMSSPFGVGNALFRYSHREQYVDTVAFGAYRREVFDEVGPYDEHLVYNEDDEFNSRLRARGGKIFLTPAIESYYHTRRSLPRLWEQYFRYGLGKVSVIQRHPQAAMLRHFVPFAFVSTLLGSGVLGLFSPVLLRVCLLVLASYLAASLLFSLRISARNGWEHLPVLPAAFACLHFSYGLGFLVGLLRLVRES